jgi:hypothetical protein
MLRVAACYGVAQLQAQTVEIAIFLSVTGQLGFVRMTADLLVRLIEQDNTIVRQLGIVWQPLRLRYAD